MTADDLFDAAGSLRDAYERVDWSATPLGPVSSWSPALRGGGRGFLEECFFTFSYSLVRAADGAAEGVLDIAAETTA